MDRRHLLHGADKRKPGGTLRSLNVDEHSLLFPHSISLPPGILGLSLSRYGGAHPVSGRTGDDRDSVMRREPAVAAADYRVGGSRPVLGERPGNHLPLRSAAASSYLGGDVRGRSWSKADGGLWPPAPCCWSAAHGLYPRPAKLDRTSKHQNRRLAAAAQFSCFLQIFRG
jgi:hypothetical protein